MRIYGVQIVYIARPAIENKTRTQENRIEDLRLDGKAAPIFGR
jgi:hypothetical protein